MPSPRSRPAAVLPLLFVGAFALCAAASASTPNVEQTIATTRLDGSPLELFVTLPNATATKVPVVLLIDGSGRSADVRAVK